MDIIYHQEWEKLKVISSLWQQETNVPKDDRDLAILDLGYGVVLPKFFCKNHFKNLKLYQVGQDILVRRNLDKHEGSPLHTFKTKIEPRKEQLVIFERIKEMLEEKNEAYGLIVASPGFGKSIVAIKAVELFNQKTLIIVPNDVLEEQFVESIIEFTNLKKEDIGVAQGSDIDNLIKKGTFKKDIVVAKIQSLYAQLKKFVAKGQFDFLYDVYSCFGLVVYDEAHVGSASDGYSKTASMFKTNNILSMTATPYRVGINDFLFTHTTGGELYVSDHQNLIPTVNLHNAHIEFFPNEIHRLRFSKNDYIKFMATYNMILETKDAYFEWIASWVEYRLSQNHSIAILFATNKMVRKLYGILQRKGIDAGILTGSTEKKKEVAIEYLDIQQVQELYDIYPKVYPKRKNVPKLKPLKKDGTKFSLTKPIKKDIEKIIEEIPEMESILQIKLTEVCNLTEREIMKSKNVIVSNFKLLSAGFDKSELSCIFFGSLIVGKVPVIQTLGRICRTHPTKNQDIQAHFMFTEQFQKFFPDMLYTLKGNIKKQYPSKFTYEGFEFQKDKK